jgi:hypothetical protein
MIDCIKTRAMLSHFRVGSAIVLLRLESGLHIGITRSFIGDNSIFRWLIFNIVIDGKDTLFLLGRG